MTMKQVHTIPKQVSPGFKLFSTGPDKLVEGPGALIVVGAPNPCVKLTLQSSVKGLKCRKSDVNTALLTIHNKNPQQLLTANT